MWVALYSMVSLHPSWHVWTLVEKLVVGLVGTGLKGSSRRESGPKLLMWTNIFHHGRGSGGTTCLTFDRWALLIRIIEKEARACRCTRHDDGRRDMRQSRSQLIDGTWVPTGIDVTFARAHESVRTWECGARYSTINNEDSVPTPIEKSDWYASHASAEISIDVLNRKGKHNATISTRNKKNDGAQRAAQITQLLSLLTHWWTKGNRCRARCKKQWEREMSGERKKEKKTKKKGLRIGTMCPHEPWHELRAPIVKFIVRLWYLSLRWG